MQFDATRDQWIGRFVIRFARHAQAAEPSDFLDLAASVWPSRGQVEPEEAADSEFALRGTGDGGEELRSFASTAQFPDEPEDFERTIRIAGGASPISAEYVRDNDEWVRRCVDRVLQLDPIIDSGEARRSVGDLAQLERWRLMRPEAAAEQLYTPIKRPS